MGISANHARLLALTARKCDLETQMQVILNNKVNSAKETSKIANTYNDAISDRKLSIFKPVTNNAPITGGASNDPTQSMYQDLSGKNLYNAGGLLLVAKGAGDTYSQVTTNLAHDAIEQGLRDGTYALVTKATLQTQDPKAITFSSVAGSGYMGGSGNVNIADALSTTSWELVDWRSSTTILDQLDKTNDEEAERNYERLMNELKEKEAEMDVEMNEIETQHSAISNELESTKKIMTKNTEDSFKYFS